MLFSMIWRRSETSCLERLMLVMASCIGIVVFRDTTGCMDMVTLCLW